MNTVADCGATFTAKVRTIHLSNLSEGVNVISCCAQPYLL